MTNCVNCGAVLKGNVCEYCGTRYTDNKLTVDIENGFTGKLRIADKVYEVYLADVDAKPIIGGPYRDAYGKVHCVQPIFKHKFQLIEI